MYIVRIIDKNNKVDDLYEYESEIDARSHFNLFKMDTSGYNKRVELIEANKQQAVILDLITFKTHR